MISAEHIVQDLQAIRQRRPLVHSMTNFVVMNETANAILCLGALPVMAHAREEVEEMVAVSGALVLNIGTLTSEWIDSMELAGKRANELGVPVILDPVGAGATRFRTDSCKRLLDSVQVSVIRGNAGEVAAICGIASEVRGVESIGAGENAQSIAVHCVSEYGCTVAVTGAVDVVADKTRLASVSNGHAMMGKVVGTGCMSSVMVACFNAVDKDSFAASVGALVTYGIAGEIAAGISGDRPGTFHCELYNALYAVDADNIAKSIRVA